MVNRVLIMAVAVCFGGPLCETASAQGPAFGGRTGGGPPWAGGISAEMRRPHSTVGMHQRGPRQAMMFGDRARESRMQESRGSGASHRGRGHSGSRNHGDAQGHERSRGKMNHRSSGRHTDKGGASRMNHRGHSNHAGRSNSHRNMRGPEGRSRSGRSHGGRMSQRSGTQMKHRSGGTHGRHSASRDSASRGQHGSSAGKQVEQNSPRVQKPWMAGRKMSGSPQVKGHAPWMRTMQAWGRKGDRSPSMRGGPPWLMNGTRSPSTTPQAPRPDPRASR